MPVPAFNADGVIPPYIGANGPGGAMHEMSPYVATCADVVQVLGTTQNRLNILHGWFQHRSAIRALGFVSGFQWLDGSFLEDKDPHDLDLVTLFQQPAAYQQNSAAFIQANQHVIDRQAVKLTFRLDHFWVDLNAGADSIVTLARYYFGLFSHRRLDDLWKGMLEVNLADATEAAASALVAGAVAANPAAGP